MAKQVNLDACQIEHMGDLLRRGTEVVNRTNIPIILYRTTVDESGDSYEEIVCTLTRDYVIEQSLTYGGPVPLSFGEQVVHTISEYPAVLMGKSLDLFERVAAQIKEELDD